MRYKDIEVSVLLLVYTMISKPVIWILAIVYIFLIINDIIQDGSDTVVKIYERWLESK